MSTGLRSDGRFLREVVVDSTHGVFAVDDSGTIVFSNGVLEECLGYDSGNLLEESLPDLATDGRTLDRVREAADAEPGEPVEFALEGADGDRVGMAATCETTEFEGSQYVTLWCQERRLGGDVDSDGAGVDSGTADTGETSVAELTDLWRDLLGTDEPAAVAESGLDAVQRFLGSDVACVRFLDEGSNALERVATTERAAELIDSRPAFDLHRSLAGRALRRGEPVVDRPDADEERTNLHVPIDGHGTLSVFGTGTGLAPRQVDEAENIASVIAASLERRDEGPRGRSESPSPDLPVRAVVAEAIESETRETIGQRVCERLVADGPIAGVWFVETDVDGAWRAVEAEAGDTDAPPEGVMRAATGAAESEDPVSRAVETDEVCLVRHSRTVREGDGTGDSGTETVETTAVVPVSHADRTYGVLVLQSADGTDAPLRPELDLLSDVVGLAVAATESRKLLLSEEVQQLEFEVTDPDCLAVGVSRATDATCEVEHRTLTNDGDHLCYLQVEGCPPERAREATADLGSVTDCRVVETGEDGCLLEVIKRQSGAEALMDVGATVRRATAEGGVGRLVVETPLSADVREVVDAYTDLNPESHLVAKREIDRSVSTADALGQRVDDTLTEKQHSVLTSAYYAGYFEWPRANTAEEVADSLDISPATFHQHLRAAERKLIELVCEDEPRPAET